MSTSGPGAIHLLNGLYDARLLGLEGICVDFPDAVGEAWDRALTAGRPALREFLTDPEVPPLPPHIRSEQAQGMAKALASRDPAAGRMVKESPNGKLAEFVSR